MSELQIAIILTGFSDQKLAEELRLPVPTLTRWRTGENAPHQAMVKALIEKIKELKK